jgi:carbonic anhydrase
MGKRLFEAIIDANHRALAGDAEAGLHPAEFEDELPLVALTCVDARLNKLLPQVLGVPPEQFIWLRNAGNIISGPMSSTMRSLALACAVKGGKQIVIIGHTDCQVGKTTAMQLLDQFKALGIERHMLPDNLTEFFGIFSSARQNVIKSVELARSSPVVGPNVPVQGLLVDIETGNLEWLVNGYQSIASTGSRSSEAAHSAGETSDALKPLAGFNLGEIKFPETKIGELAGAIADDLAQKMHLTPTGAGAPSFSQTKIGDVVAAIGEEISQKIHQSVPTSKPPPLRSKIHVRKGSK